MGGGPGGVPGWFEELQGLGLEADVDTYTAMVDAAVEKGDLREAEKWVDKAREDGAGMDAAKLLAFAREAVTAKRTDAAKMWLKQSIKGGAQIDKPLFNTVVGMIVREEYWKAAHEWIVEVGEDPGAWLPQHSGQLREILVRAMKRRSRKTEAGFTEAAAVLEEAIRYGADPDEDSFRILIRQALYLHRLDDVSRLFKKAVQHGKLLPISMVNAIIGEVAKTQGFLGAELWFTEARHAGIEPNSYTFRYMMQAATKDEDQLAPARWYNYSIEAGCPPDVVTFNTLITAATKRGRLQEAEEWFDEAEKVGVAPDTLTFNLLISAATNSGNFVAAERWFQQATEPDMITYNTFMNAAVKAARPWQVEELFGQVLQVGLKPDHIMLTQMRFALGRNRVADLCKLAGVDATMIQQRGVSKNAR